MEEEGKVQNRQNGRRKVRELLYLSVAYAANTGGVSNSDTYEFNPKHNVKEWFRIRVVARTRLAS